MYTVTFPSVFGCNAFLKLKVPFSRSVYRKTYENGVRKQKRFKRLVVLALYRVNRKVEGENEMPCLNRETKTKN